MKHILFSIFFFGLSTQVVFAQADMCNLRCDVDGDCGSGYRCYVGVCRLDNCPSSSNCNCAMSTSATPVATATAQPLSSATPSPTQGPTPTPIATVSAVLSTSPKTGFESWMVAGVAFVLFILGTGMASVDALFVGKGATPSQMVASRKARKN